MEDRKVWLLTKDVANGSRHNVAVFKPQLVTYKKMEEIRWREIKKLRAKEKDLSKHIDIYVYFQWEEEGFDINRLAYFHKRSKPE